MDGTSRMNREVHVRICERLGAQFPGPTRRLKGVAEDHVKWGLDRRAQANLWIKRRNRTTTTPKPWAHSRSREQYGGYLLTGCAVSGAEEA